MDLMGLRLTRTRNKEVERDLLAAKSMIIIALLTIWFAASLLFCLALARAASRPQPHPSGAEELAGAPHFGYEEAPRPARLGLRTAMARGMAVPSRG